MLQLRHFLARLLLLFVQLLKAAAKALSKGAQAYNAVPEHTDSKALETAAGLQGTLQSSRSLKHYHSRSRSMAAISDLLALGSGASTGNGWVSGAVLPGNHSLPGSPCHKPAAGSDGEAGTGPGLRCNSSGSSCAAALPGGIYLGCPGSSSTHGGHHSRSNSSGEAINPSINGGNSLQQAIALSISGFGNDGSCAHSCSGCSAPSFAAGLLVAVLLKGRYPEEYHGVWNACPRIQSLGLGEGTAICEQLRKVKLALNAGDYTLLETASPAVAAVVLADWFEGFNCEALTEATLGLLVDEADELLEESSAACIASSADGRPADDARHPTKAAATAAASRSGAGAVLLEVSRRSLKKISSVKRDASKSSRKGSLQSQQQLQQQQQQEPLRVTFADPSPFQQQQQQDLEHRQLVARSVVCSLTAYEQDLFLCLAAVLRHAQLASVDDSRVPDMATGCSSDGAAQPPGVNRILAGTLPAVRRTPEPESQAADMLGNKKCKLSCEECQQRQCTVEAEVMVVMKALYRVVAAWLLGPLAVACNAALEATAAFLQFLTQDDVGFK
jgi:hypothetical protein